MAPASTLLPAFGLAVLGVAVHAGCASGSSATQDWALARNTSPPGAAVYKRECASCHGEKGDGSRGVPPVVGSGALPVRRDGRPPLRTAFDVYDYVSKTMPLPAKFAGTLPPEGYWSVVEFILSAHGVELPGEGLNAGNAGGVIVNQGN
jgi:mono/diheme cytochrome c family protein